MIQNKNCSLFAYSPSLLIEKDCARICETEGYAPHHEQAVLRLRRHGEAFLPNRHQTVSKLGGNNVKGELRCVNQPQDVRS